MLSAIRHLVCRSRRGITACAALCWLMAAASLCTAQESNPGVAPVAASTERVSHHHMSHGMHHAATTTVTDAADTVAMDMPCCDTRVDADLKHCCDSSDVPVSEKVKTDTVANVAVPRFDWPELSAEAGMRWSLPPLPRQSSYPQRHLLLGVQLI